MSHGSPQKDKEMFATRLARFQRGSPRFVRFTSDPDELLARSISSFSIARFMSSVKNLHDFSCRRFKIGPYVSAETKEPSVSV